VDVGVGAGVDVGVGAGVAVGWAIAVASTLAWTVASISASDGLLLQLAKTNINTDSINSRIDFR